LYVHKHAIFSFATVQQSWHGYAAQLYAENSLHLLECKGREQGSASVCLICTLREAAAGSKHCSLSHQPTCSPRPAALLTQQQTAFLSVQAVQHLMRRSVLVGRVI
jgi:hypothetical protein